MAKWIIKLITIGFVMTFVLRVLPDNSVKRAAQMAFGIIFLIVTVLPIGKLFADGFTSHSITEYFEHAIAGIPDGNYDDKYVDDVIDTYCANIEDSVENIIYDETGSRCEVLVTVCSDVSSENFGKVISAKCNIVSVEENNSNSDSDTKEENSVISDVSLVKDIVISFDGVSGSDGKKDDEERNELLELQNEIADVLCKSLGIENDMCTFTQ